MKTNKITLMIMGLAVASLFASCKKNDNNAVVGEGFRAFTEQGGNGSRTHGVADGNTIAVQWTSGDQILVANQGGAGSQLTYNLKSGANSTEGSFANTNESSDFLQPDYVAIYPATNANGVANSISGTTATFSLPATQTYLEGSFAEKSMPMVAYSTEQSLQFKNVLGGLCFPIVANGLTVTKIEVISANTSEALWGECTTTISATDAPTSIVSNSEANKNVITLDCGSGIMLDATTATDFYVMVPAGTLESGFTVKAYNGNNVIYEKSTASAPGANFIPRSVVRKVNSNLTIAIAVTTISPSHFTMNSATGYAQVSHQVKETGLLYANVNELSGNPNALVVGGTGVHKLSTSSPSTYYALEMTNLAVGMVYYVRAYAKAQDDTYIYGNAVPFATRRDYFTGANAGMMIKADGTPYEFSVSPTKKVGFSIGNLQYIGSAPTPCWKFAENQFDFYSLRNGQNSNSQTVDRDLFGWATSGYNLRGTEYNYQPYSTAAHESGVCTYGPLGYYNLTGTYANGDWGVNAISNGGGQPNQWRTLQGADLDGNTAEWDYLLTTTTNANRSTYRYVKVRLWYGGNINVPIIAYVGDTVPVNCGADCGMIVFPDNYVWPSAYIKVLSEINTPSGVFFNNQITEAQWSLLEWAGAVYLPAADYRTGTTIEGNPIGYYWSATHYPIANNYYANAYYLLFGSSLLNPQADFNRSAGMSVRLVSDIN